MTEAAAEPELVTIPCREDNYAFLLRDRATDHVILVDAPETGPIRAELERRGWTLDDILITHHHDDHIAAVADLRPGARIIGAADDAHRLPPLDLKVRPGQVLTLGPFTVHVIAAPGHTSGHVAYHVPQARAVFTGDSLMALGCGRLFEGTAADMYGTLTRIAALPDDTLVCSGHEYTLGNAKFARAVNPDNAALCARIERDEALRIEDRPTIPSRLGEERETNPFLRCNDPAIRAVLGMEDATETEVFAELRDRKDRF